MKYENQHTDDTPTIHEELELRRALIHSKLDVPDVDAEWDRFVKKVEENHDGEVEISPARSYLHFFGIAAAIIVLLVLGVWYTHHGTSVTVFHARHTPNGIVVRADDKVIEVVQQKKSLLFNKHVDKKFGSSAVKMLEVTTPRGKDGMLVLSDGTKVWLNADSRIVFPNVFVGKSREVFVQGEAFFEVTQNKKLPFVVKNDFFTTTVCGTMFNVRAYTHTDASLVLVEGKVLVCSQTGKNLMLKPGQKITYHEPNNMTLHDVDVYPYIQWKDGFFYFENNKLVEIMMELGRWYNVNVVFEHEEDMERRLHFVAERTETLSTVVKRLNALGVVSVHVEDDQLSIE